MSAVGTRGRGGQLSARIEGWGLPCYLTPASWHEESKYVSFATVREHVYSQHWPYSKLRVNRIQWNLKNNLDHAKIQITWKKCIAFGQFDQKICSHYAIIRITWIGIGIWCIPGHWLLLASAWHSPTPTILSILHWNWICPLSDCFWIARRFARGE